MNWPIDEAPLAFIMQNGLSDIVECTISAKCKKEAKWERQDPYQVYSIRYEESRSSLLARNPEERVEPSLVPCSF